MCCENQLIYGRSSFAFEVQNLVIDIRKVTSIFFCPSCEEYKEYSIKPNYKNKMKLNTFSID